VLVPPTVAAKPADRSSSDSPSTSAKAATVKKAGVGIRPVSILRSGIPDRTRLADGDLVSIDCGAFVGGWCADAAISFVVGTPRPQADHGVGRAMHEDPFLTNEGRPGRGYRLRPGLVIAIEPMLVADGTDEYVTARDGWTIRTATGARAAHSEQTIAITDNGPVILTAL